MNKDTPDIKPKKKKRKVYFCKECGDEVVKAKGMICDKCEYYRNQ